MAALTQDRNTRWREGQQVRHPMAAAAKVYAGALVFLDEDGNATSSVAAGKSVAGVAQEAMDNSAGAAGAASVLVKRGVFHFHNSAGGDEIGRAELMGAAYAADDQTLAKTDGGEAARPFAGLVVDVDDDGVWVLVDPIIAGLGQLSAGAAALDARVEAVEAFEARIEAVEAFGARLDAAEAAIQALDGRVTALEGA